MTLNTQFSRDISHHSKKPSKCNRVNSINSQVWFNRTHLKNWKEPFLAVLEEWVCVLNLKMAHGLWEDQKMYLMKLNNGFLVKWVRWEFQEDVMVVLVNHQVLAKILIWTIMKTLLVSINRRNLGVMKISWILIIQETFSKDKQEKELRHVAND